MVKDELSAHASSVHTVHVQSELVIGFFFVDVCASSHANNGVDFVMRNGDKVHPVPEVSYIPIAEPDKVAQTQSDVSQE